MKTGRETDKKLIDIVVILSFVLPTDSVGRGGGGVKTGGREGKGKYDGGRDREGMMEGGRE